MRDPIRWFKCKLKPPKNQELRLLFALVEKWYVEQSEAEKILNLNFEK